eukprot:TRINITY_DN5683_c0_g1_i1.p1 TRINITY_DN5683_c0_g1~~TRINITY_DN5683_c0_g1_i1.p1  ORF type:complete len:303 (-),score=50.22 TRINITY_DN5683_c0_g1_i1:33-941(-)
MLLRKANICSRRAVNQTRMVSDLRNPNFVVNRLNEYALSEIALNKDYPKAKKLLDKAYEICVKYSHPKYFMSKEELEDPVGISIEELEKNVKLPAKYAIFTLESIAKLNAAEGNYMEAKENIEKAISLAQKDSDKINSKKQKLGLKLAEICFNLRDFKQADEILSGVLEGDKALRGLMAKNISQHTSFALYWKGLVAEQMGNLEDAAQILTSSWETHRKVFGVHDDRTFKVVNALAKVQMKLEKYEDARTNVELLGTYYTSRKRTEMLGELVELHNIITSKLGVKGARNVVSSRNGAHINDI